MTLEQDSDNSTMDPVSRGLSPASTGLSVKDNNRDVSLAPAFLERHSVTGTMSQHSDPMNEMTRVTADVANLRAQVKVLKARVNEVSARDEAQNEYLVKQIKSQENKSEQQAAALKARFDERVDFARRHSTSLVAQLAMQLETSESRARAEVAKLRHQLRTYLM